VLRGRRNHEAVVEALLVLIEEGELHPTAKAIAERAGLSRRCVFQHFPDMEHIYAAAGETVGRRLLPYLQEVPADAPLPERLRELLRLRRSLLLAVDPLARAGRIQEHESSQLQANRRRLNEMMRQQCRQAFAPELDRMPPVDRVVLEAALGVATSWPVWDHLRTEFGYGADRIMIVMAAIATGLLDEAASRLDVLAVPK
jgi:TetR/AcrR family transcriptional regulator of autoinduction and epiphytic fitness